MSLTTTVPVKQYRIGIICSKALDDPDFLPELVGPHLAAISHVYSNGANDLVAAFAASHGLPLTTFPLTGGRSLPWSLSQILGSELDFVYIVADPSSKSAASAVEACVKREIKHKVIPFSPYMHYAEKVGKTAEILSAVPKEEIEANPILKALWRVV
jgi:hypothetical protein